MRDNMPAMSALPAGRTATEARQVQQHCTAVSRPGLEWDTGALCQCSHRHRLNNQLPTQHGKPTVSAVFRMSDLFEVRGGRPFG